ncbi:MAG: hypothetical protein Ct9H300mP8_05980 [Gammaproteobacteria bacterium]|nr:MAG: hypothetical protein Ct9H300mP8_05980 [Gammaproteobacteria bacterium]
MITQDPVQSVKVIATIRRCGLYVVQRTLGSVGTRAHRSRRDPSGSQFVDLVLDLRYNGGGYLDIANELAFMIAGSAQAAGKVFSEVQFNDKHPSTNPVTGASLEPQLFHASARGVFSIPGGSVANTGP